MTFQNSPEQSVNEDLRRQFEAAWIAGEPKSIEDCLPAGEDPTFLPTLEELIHIDLEFGWKEWSLRRRESSKASQRPTLASPIVERYLARFPQLNQPDILLRVLEQEYLMRNQHGDQTDRDDYQRRFPHVSNVAANFETFARMRQQGTNFGAPPGEKRADAPVCSSQLGNYELLDEIGRGGMGVVYRARQLAADRIVALKVIRPEYSSSALSRKRHDSLLDRFRTEARAAARLEHENIVTVYDVGEENGQHFFSMRFVEGKSLSELLRDGPLPNRRAATYVEQAARGVHVAHEHNILHRDIKPQNVLVDDKTDHALVADFGLAKLLEGTDELTRAGEMMGTPAYMSAEQAQDAASVGPASDVYSLGATLYHLVTGRPPFQAASPIETIRQVIADEPVAPSRLNRAVDRDLETICLKCLEKEPARRYASARALADDLARYLEGQPIVARPLGRVQRAVRWCDRNRLVAASLALAVTFLLAALTATTIGYATTIAALEQSERRYSQTRQVVNEFFVDVSDNVLLNQPGLQTLRKSLLRRVLPHYQAFLAERRDDPALRQDLAKAHFRVGLILLEIESADAALPSLGQARTIQTVLVEQDARNTDKLYDLAATWNAIGEAEYDRGKSSEAVDSFIQAKQLRQQLVDIEKRPEYQRVLANAEMNLGLALKAKQQFDEARQQLEKAQLSRLDLLDRKVDDFRDEFHLRILRDFAIGEYSRANLALLVRDRPAVAVPLANAIQRFEELKNSQPQDFDAQYRLALSYSLLAQNKMSSREYGAASEPLNSARSIADRLVDLNPHVNDFQVLASSVYMNVGSLEQREGKLNEALESFKRAKSILDEIIKVEPLPPNRRNLARTHCSMANIYIDQKHWPAANRQLQNARDALGGAPDETKSTFELVEFIEKLQGTIDRQ